MMSSMMSSMVSDAERVRLLNWARVCDGWAERATREAHYGLAAVFRRQANDARRSASQPDLMEEGAA